ncbi:hypothetical protein ABEB36_013361 [Hypothenemus hampei]|uniref:NEDD4-binding protein 2 n=1 Tax=Hypothenemus hampei TaxID=57062 RepID=A0ABD1E7Y1_HYPHA
MASFHYNIGEQPSMQNLNHQFGDKLNIQMSVVSNPQLGAVRRTNGDRLYEIRQNPFNSTSNVMNSESNNRKSKKAFEIERVINEINQGYKVLVLVRGVPGSGKSTLAKMILQNTIGDNYDYAKKHILSTDDYFMKNGVYQFDPNSLSDAHGWNQQRAFSVMSKGYSPVIIDNTNTQMWEMKPYATMATDYGYFLEILEPDTHWFFNDKELEKRNKHGVPKAAIKNMLERYEKNVIPIKLLAAYDLKYKFQRPPQFRLQPPFSGQFSTNELSSIRKAPSPIASSSVDDILMQSDSTLLNAPVLKPVTSSAMKQSTSLFDSMNKWGVDEKALHSWDIVTPLKDAREIHSPILISDDEDVIETREMSTCTEDTDFTVLRNIDTIPPPIEYMILRAHNREIYKTNAYPRPTQTIARKLMIDKSCLTEDLFDEHHAHLEQLEYVFPNLTTKIIKYWYEKCNCDFDCTIELLLNEREEVIHSSVDDEMPVKNEKEEVIVEVPSDVVQSPSSPIHKRKLPSNSQESIELKMFIESKVTINDKHYSEKLLKIKQARYGEPSAIDVESDVHIAGRSSVDDEHQENKLDSDDSDWEMVYAQPKEKTIEMNLGEHFVKQLEEQFGDSKLVYPKGFQPVVQIPESLARQLYTFYIESVYQQMDNQNALMDDLVKEDEEFARKLQESEENIVTVPEGSPFKLPDKEPTELTEIMKEQRVLVKWQKEAEKWKEDTPDTLAARLTRNKLFKAFPRLNKDTLIEILHAHNNVYKDTVETLLASTNETREDFESLINPPINETVMEEMRKAHDDCSEEQTENSPKTAQEYREEANKYLEKRSKLYEKVQIYHQKGMREVAQFYSGLASKQTKLFEQANSLAATAFVDEHSKRLEDCNTLDLHFLYVKEAIPNLDIFLDRNINLLRLSTTMHSDSLQIITGRGKNSAGGLSRIRPAVITRLKERKLSYNHLNPGLLRVKVTRNSKLTCEL